MKQLNYTKTNIKKSRFAKACFVLLLFLTGSSVSAQANYTWMKGSTISGQAGVYGTMGIPSANNTPGGREVATSWKDASGNFWVFGGIGYDGSGNFGFLNDMWKYTLSTNQWTWIGGSNTSDQDGIYGTMGVPSSFNMPGSREGAVSWVDASGNFWMFGGIGWDGSTNIGELNDLWKYNVSTNQWTWIKGSNIYLQNGVYGTQGVSANANTPGARPFSATWVDASGNLWLFGGEGYDGSSNYGSLNDLWKYNIATNQWTWMKGANAVDQNGIYGTMGTAAPANNPGGRYLTNFWSDASGNFWMHAGGGYDATNTSEDLLNDLWKYNVATNQWTWMKGSNTSGQFGTYGSLGVAAASNLPGGRVAGISWKDASGNFFTFGGFGNDGSSGQDILNDLWKYNTTTNQWTWIKGSNLISQIGIYGTQGLPGAANTPGARGGAIGWTDASFNLWLFGGNGYDASSAFTDDLNDLWRLSNCQANPTVVVNTSTTAVCLGGSATLTASGATTYSWSGGQTSTVVVVTPSLTGAINYTTLGSDYNGCSSTVSLSLNVFAIPLVTVSGTKPGICRGQQIILTATGGGSYLWNTSPASTANPITLTPTVTTTYIVTGTDGNGCSKTLSVTQTVNLCTGIETAEAAKQSYLAYPNPNNGSFTLSGPGFEAGMKVIIFNTLGQKVFEEKLTSGETNVQTQLTTGVYHYNVIQNDKKIDSGKIIVQ